MASEVNELPGVSIYRRAYFSVRRLFVVSLTLKLLILIIVISYICALAADDTVRFSVNSWFERVNAGAGFTVKNVYLEGVVNSDAQAIETLVSPYRGQSLLSVDLHDLKSDLEKLSWSDVVLVERMFPSTLSIRIREHRPVAVWQHAGRFYLVNGLGEVITDVDEYFPFGDILLVSGERAVEHVRELNEWLSKYKTVQQFVASARFVGERRWDLFLKNGALVRLPEEDTDSAFRNVVKWIDNGVLSSKSVKTVDLKETGRVYMEKGGGDSQRHSGGAPAVKRDR